LQAVPKHAGGRAGDRMTPDWVRGFALTRGGECCGDGIEADFEEEFQAPVGDEFVHVLLDFHLLGVGQNWLWMMIASLAVTGVGPGGLLVRHQR
jgi:hypothetical protein